MIEAIRRYTSSWVVKGLFIVLVLSFVLWGVADVFRPGSTQQWAAEIDGSEIPVDAFAREYQQQVRRIRSESGSTVSAEDLQRSGLPQMVLERMINTQLLDAAADRLDLVVASETVTQAIAADRRFRNAAGQFDPQIFRLALREIGLNEAQYLALQQNDLRRTQIIAGIGETIAPPDALTAMLARYFFEQRSAQYVTVPLPAAAEVGTPDRSQLRAFYDENAGLFTAPEYRTVTAIILNAAAFAKDMTVSQQDLQAAYANRAGEFNEAERRSFLQLVFANAEAARNAESRLLAGADFVAIGGEMLGQQAGDLTIADITRDALPDALGAAVFTQAPGVVGAPIETPLGWHIVKVTAVKPGSQRTLDEVRETLSEALRLERATEALIDVGNDLDDALGRGLKLEEAARELNLAVQTFEAIDPDGRDRAGRPIAGLPDRLVETAFATGRGEESVLTEADGNTMFVLRVDEVTPAAVRPFDSVEKETAEAWRANRRIELARQRAEGLAARARTDGDLASVAAAETLTVLTAPAVSRATMNTKPDVPRPVANAMFAAGSEKTFVARDANAFYVGRLTAIAEPPPETLADNSRALKAELSRTLASDVIRQFLAALRSEHDVRINTPALETAL